MRKLLLASVCVLAFSSNAYAQGIAVFDDSVVLEEIEELLAQGKAYALQAQQYVTENLMWTKQVSQYAMQAQQYAVEAEQLLAFVHNPSLGTAMPLLNAAGLGSSMPVNPFAVLSLLRGLEYGNGGLPEINGLLSSVSSLSVGAYGAQHIYSPTDGSWASQQLIATANSIAGTQGTAMAAYGDLKTHAAALQSLREHLVEATTPKDVQDAQAQIELETTWTANQQAQIASIQASYFAQQDSRVQRGREELTMSLDNQISQARNAGIIQ